VAALVAAVVIARLQPFRATAPRLTVERVTLRPIAFPRNARFTPDGRVVFTAREGRTEELFERNLASASIQPLGLQNMVMAATSSTGELAVFLTSDPFVPGPISATLARVPGGGGTPHVVAEDVISADWSPAGELAIVRSEGVHILLEFPVGKTVFQTTRPAWIGNVRISPRGDLLAFIHYSGRDYQGEVVVVDLQGRKRHASRHWSVAIGLAWSPRNEVWFGAGDSSLATQIQAMPLTGPERTVYTALAPIVLQDIAADGSVLVGQGLVDWDIIFLGQGAPNPRSLTWYDLPRGWPRLSADGRLLLFSAYGPRTELVALLRKTTGAPPQNLGEGRAWDLSPDGRWALLQSGDGLTLVATGTGTRRHIPLPGLHIGAARFLGSTSRAVAVARASTDSRFRLYTIDLDGTGATPLSEPLADLGYLEMSPDNRWAATNAVVDEKYGPVLHPLAGGKPVMLTGLGPNVSPIGWASNDELWFARIDDSDPSVIGLIRFDVRRRVIVEERTIGTRGPVITAPPHLTADGKNIVFVEQRIAGHLYVIRGLAGAR
jgi:hypothetical protein